MHAVIKELDILTGGKFDEDLDYLFFGVFLFFLSISFP